MNPDFGDVKKDILSVNREELSEYFKSAGHPSYRANQIFEWLHIKKIFDFDKFTNISAQMREDLKRDFYICSLKLQKKLVSKSDNTVKYAYQLNNCFDKTINSDIIETVSMEYKYGTSLCISTQAGCKMGCNFCASAESGFSRNLTVSEMLMQVYTIENELNCNVNNLVLMGIGEPLDNYDNVIKFVNIITDQKGRDFAGRKITISTCGLADKIDELAKLKLSLQLSVSLHSPFDKTREQIMPVNKKFPLKKLLESVKNYADITGKRITFEYALIKGFNDSEDYAHELLKILSPIHCHINLIPVNLNKTFKIIPSDAKDIKKFKNIIENSGISVTVRRTLGADINAACGQLRKQKKVVV